MTIETSLHNEQHRSAVSNHTLVEESGLQEAYKSMMAVYGPYAFGFAMMLTVWHFIVSPELSRRTVDHEANVKVMRALEDVTRSTEATSRTLEKTSAVLEALVKELRTKG
jgi:hypothetical protein